MANKSHLKRKKRNCESKTVIESQSRKDNQSDNLIVFRYQLCSLSKFGRITTL